jgi:4-hydroxy-3-methylbut-2-enyl diphosphate reductase
VKTFHISSAKEMENKNALCHYKFRSKERIQTKDYLPENATILLTSGASCPDAMVEEVINKLLDFYKITV